MIVFCVIGKGILLAIFEKKEDAEKFATKERLAIVENKEDADSNPENIWVEVWNVQ